MKRILLLSVILFNFFVGYGQVIMNSEFDGIPDFSGQNFSDFLEWERVPATDPVCLANIFDHTDTPDLTFPNSSDITGNPYQGQYFVSGLHVSNSSGSYYFQEGVMQNVVGFNIGCVYTLDFYQAVVKQNNCLDQSCSWSVYIDDMLVGTSTPSFSDLAVADNNLIWENRTITFTATATSHTIKFLPFDDDDNVILSNQDITGGLRMGLDLVTISNVEPFSLGPDITACSGQTVELSAPSSLSDYIWYDGTSSSTSTVSQSGSYWLTSTSGCIFSDTLTVIFNSIFPQIYENNGEFSTDNYDAYQWYDCQSETVINSENNQNYYPESIGDYAVIVNSNGCIDTSECLPWYIIPTAFTPDGDLAHDFWEIPNLDERFPNNVVNVYNRWGGLVFTSQQGKYNEQPWDGTYNNEPLPVGSYYYVIEPNDGVSKGLNGTVTILLK